MEALEGKGLPGLAAAFVRVNHFYYTEFENTVLAQLRSDNSNAYRATSEIMPDYALRLANVGALITDAPVEELRLPIRTAIGTILSIYNDGVLGAEYFKRPSPEILEQIFVMIVERRLIK